MTLKIGVVSQKGGPGKSTVARGIAVALAQSGWVVKIADLDTKQSTAANWQRRRLEQGIEPALFVECFGSVAQALRSADDYDAVIFDGAPHATIATADIARTCDLTIIPTGLSLDDLQPTVALAEELRTKHGIEARRIAFALNHVGDSVRELEEAKAYLAATPYKTLEGHLPQKTAFSRAHDQGLSVIETPFKGPREAAEQLMQAAMQRIDELNK